jgi:hypothetical protein
MMDDTTRELNEIIQDNPFYVDPAQPGIIRGGWLDEMGGFLIGVHARQVAERLNASAAKENDV